MSCVFFKKVIKNIIFKSCANFEFIDSILILVLSQTYFEPLKHSEYKKILILQNTKNGPETD